MGTSFFTMAFVCLVTFPAILVLWHERKMKFKRVCLGTNTKDAKANIVDGGKQEPWYSSARVDLLGGKGAIRKCCVISLLHRFPCFPTYDENSNRQGKISGGGKIRIGLPILHAPMLKILKRAYYFFDSFPTPLSPSEP